MKIAIISTLAFVFALVINAKIESQPVIHTHDPNTAQFWDALRIVPAEVTSVKGDDIETKWETAQLVRVTTFHKKAGLTTITGKKALSKNDFVLVMYCKDDYTAIQIWKKE